MFQNVEKPVSMFEEGEISTRDATTRYAFWNTIHNKVISKLRYLLIQWKYNARKSLYMWLM